MVVNGLLMTPAFICAIYYPSVGNVAGLAGAFGTMFCIYILPISTYLKYKWDENHDPSKIHKIIDEIESSPNTALNRIKDIQEIKSKQQWRFVLLCALGALIVSYGVSILVLNINAFVNSLGG